MPTTILQRKLVLDDSPALVLATVETARHQLPGHDEDDIVAAIEEGILLFAWNIGLMPGRRELRIFPPCIDHYRRTGGRHPFERSDAQVLSDLLGPALDKPFLRSTTLRLLLNCSSTHIINLISAGALHVVPNTTWGQGPTGAALVTVPSLKQFLTHRRA